MPLCTYTIAESEKWDEVVRSFARHDVYYLSGYVKAFQIHGDGQPMLFYYEDAGVRGINVVMKRDIAADPFFRDKISPGMRYDFISPYGYGGWLLEGNGDPALLFATYESWCADHNIVSEFVRYHPVLNNAEATRQSYDVVILGNTISLDLSSQEVIWANLTSKNRNMVRKAQKSGVKIHRGQFPDIYKTFREIYNLTMDSDNAKPYYYFAEEFYDSICNDLPEEAQVFWAEYEGKAIAASIMLSVNGYMSYHLSGSLREYQHMAPTNLLLYKAALWGCRNGCRSLHLGGGVGSKEDSLFKFKSSFNRSERLQFAIGKKVFLPDAYHELTVMKNPKEAGGFFPGYRA